MDTLFPLLPAFRRKLEKKQKEKEEEEERQMLQNSAFHQAYLQKTVKNPRFEEEIDEEPLNLLSINTPALIKVLKRFAYVELARIEESCRKVRDSVAEMTNRAQLNVFGLHFKRGSIMVAFDKETYNDYTLAHINRTTRARIKANLLIIEDELTAEVVNEMLNVFRENETLIETVQLLIQPHAIQLPTLHVPEFFKILSLCKVKRLGFGGYCLPLGHFDRPEIKELKAIDGLRPVGGDVNGSFLLQLPCPILKIENDELSADTLTALLQQWKSFERDIKCLTVENNFDPQHLLNPNESLDLDAEPIWTYYEQDRRIIQFIPMGKGKSQTDVQILLIKRGDNSSRTAEDCLILFFGKIRFVAATLDGIADEDILDKLYFF